MLVTFLEKLTHSPKSNSTYPFSFHFKIPEIRSSKKPFLQKRRKRTLVMFFLKKKTQSPKLTFKKTRKGEGGKEGEREGEREGKREEEREGKREEGRKRGREGKKNR
jgi:hypothetical protein